MNKKYAFDIQVSDSCQLHCTHCIMDLHTTDVDFEAIKSKLREIRDKIGYQDVDVHFSGGEPFFGINNGYSSTNANINTEDIPLYNLILYIKNLFKSATFYMTTNLLNYNSFDIYKTLSQIDYISTSFDLGRFGNIKNLLLWVKNVKRLSKKLKENNKNRLKIITTMTKRNIDSHNSAERFLKLFRKLDVDFCFVPWMIKKNSEEYRTYEDFYETRYLSSLVYRNFLRSVYSCDHKYNLDDRDKTVDLILSNNFFACMYNSNTIYGIDNMGNEARCIFNRVCDSRYTYWQCKLIYPFDRFSTILRDDCCKDFIEKAREYGYKV